MESSIDKIIPIGRFGEAEECAAAVSFLVLIRIKFFKLILGF